MILNVIKKKHNQILELRFQINPIFKFKKQVYENKTI